MHINTPPTFQAAVLTSHNIFKDQADIFSPPPLFSSLPPFFSKLKSEEKTTRKAERMKSISTAPCTLQSCNVSFQRL